MGESHQTLDIDRVCRDFHTLHQNVTRAWGRIEITRDGGEPCVLLSKAELESIERALEILNEMPAGKQVNEEIARIARDCMESPRSNAPAALLGDNPDGQPAAV